MRKQLDEMDKWFIDPHNQIALKDKFIKSLELKLIQDEQQVEKMADATCATNEFIQKDNAICDTHGSTP